ncbi:MAG: hypothetical protein FP820_04890 [Sulfurimonas sp.]|nr:hypothetical protein [Sulfurimonas sp.]MBU3940000.1 hypothetical protein [bacterium]MBU4023989.1 hypothetical protein [bacterium]MBU4058585.1 hypothetical protein [bacterium]
MKKVHIVLVLLLISFQNSFALVASDVDMNPAVVDITTIVASLVSFLVLLMGYKKVLSLLGR